jgi:pSer/pThr/pTyr-binding forkhead associated (FHA) protein
MSLNMTAVLFSKTGLFSGTSFKIDKETTIGKGDKNSVILRSEIISNNHAKITYDDSQKAYFLEDLGSSNGTLLDGTKVKGKERLEHLHVITFAGKFDFIFQVGGVIPVKTAPSVPTPIHEEKTAFDQGPGSLPSFGKKETVKEDKTMFDAGKDAPSALPQFSKPVARVIDKEKTMFDQSDKAPSPLPNFVKSKENEVEKTSFDQGKEVPLSLPNFDRSKTEEETIASQSPEPTIPVIQKKAEIIPEVKEIPTQVVRPPTSPPSTARPRFMLSVGKLNKEFELTEGQTSVGRTIGCDIIIDDVSMSRKHALITVKGDRITLKDLGSSNGTSVDKKRINTEVEVSPSSVIKLGMVEIKIKKVV